MLLTPRCWVSYSPGPCYSSSWRCWAARTAPLYNELSLRCRFILLSAVLLPPDKLHAEMSSLPELELSQLPGSSTGEGVERREEEDLGSPAAAAAASLIPAPDTADMSAPELSQLAGSSAGESVERQEDSPAVAVPPASAPETADRNEPELSLPAGEGVERQEDSPTAAPAVSARDTAYRSASELRQLSGSHTGENELQEMTSEILEADVILMPVENNLFTRVLVLPNPMAMRYVYALLFALMTIVAWFMRDMELSRFDHYACDGSHDCIAANGVLRASMALAIFFFIMFVSTVNTRKRYELRNFWHCQWWILKAAIFVVGCGFALYAPSSFIQLYGMVAHVGAWLFLVIQFFSMTKLIMWVNRWCRVESNREKWADKTYGLLPLSAAPVVLYLGSFLGLAIMYYWYAAYSEPTMVICISVAMLIVCLMFLISCVHKVSGGYLAPGLMMAYVVLMCLATIRSEPHTETGNKKTKSTTDWQDVLGFAIAAVVIITSTYTVGKDYKCIRFSNRIMLEDDVPYGYGFFHLVFTLGAMYIGMLFVGWNAHKTMEKWAVDYGWASTRVRATSGLLVGISYVLMLASQKLWDLMLAVTSNSTPSDNEARPVGDSVLPPVAA